MAETVEGTEAESVKAPDSVMVVWQVMDDD